MTSLAVGAILVIGFVIYYVWLTHTKDAPYVGMEPKVVERVMQIADVGEGDVFYDLGSGDGRLVIAAALRGARAYGVELDKYRAMYSRFWIRLLGLSGKAQIINTDLFATDLSEATVVNAYLIPETHERLKVKLKKELSKETKIVAVGFKFKNWKPELIDPRGTVYGPIYRY